MDQGRWNSVLSDTLVAAGLGTSKQLHIYAMQMPNATPQDIATAYVRDHAPKPVAKKAG